MNRKAEFSGTPEVDLIVAVHTPERDLSRAVGSVLRGTRANVRVTVVCHNTPVSAIVKKLGALSEDPRVRLLALNDGVRSPAGPFNYGLEAASAEYISVLGSDDELAAGAIDSWLRQARGAGAGAVLARVTHAGGSNVPSPPTRPFRIRALDPVRDRLCYRSAPLGLVSRERFPELRFTAGVRTGEDIGFVTELWFSASPLVYDRRGPAYLIHADGAQRVTTLSPPIREDLEFLEPLLRSDTYLQLRSEQRASVLMKTVRSSLFGLVHNRPDPEQWPATERRELARITGRLRSELATTPLREQALSRADQLLLDRMESPDAPVAELLAAARARRAFLTPRALLTTRLRHLFHREAPLRFAAASILARW